MNRIGDVHQLALAHRLATVQAFEHREFMAIALEQQSKLEQHAFALSR